MKQTRSLADGATASWRRRRLLDALGIPEARDAAHERDDRRRGS